MILRPVFACAMLALGLASPALGQPTEAQMSALKSSCRSDYMAKCMSVKPGGPEAFQCLKKNEAGLSAACRSAVNAISAASAPAQEPKQAAPAQPAAPAPAAPATASPAPASPPPAAAAPAAKPTVAAPAPKPVVAAAPPPVTAAPAQPSAAQQNALKQNCRNDFMSHCAGVQPGGAQALSCLQTNAARLSPACKSAVAAIGHGSAPKPAAPKPAVAAAPPPAAAAPVAPAPAVMPAPTLSSPQEARLIKRFCFTDFKVLCSGVRLGQGRAVQCLAANAPALSPGCKAAMTQASR